MNSIDIQTSQGYFHHKIISNPGLSPGANQIQSFQT